MRYAWKNFLRDVLDWAWILLPILLIWLMGLGNHVTSFDRTAFWLSWLGSVTLLVLTSLIKLYWNYYKVLPILAARWDIDINRLVPIAGRYNLFKEKDIKQWDRQGFDKWLEGKLYVQSVIDLANASSSRRWWNFRRR